MSDQKPSRGFSGALVKLWRGGDYELTVTGRTEVTPNYLRLHFEGKELLTGRPLHPTMWVRGWFPDGAAAESFGDPGGEAHEPEIGAPLGETLGQQGSPGDEGKQQDAPPEPDHGSDDREGGPENAGDRVMQLAEAGTEQVERQRHHREAGHQGDRGPEEEECGGRVVVSLAGQRLPVPLVPLVAQPAVHVDVDQLRTGGVRHTGTR